jgi:hypothetical protein
MSYGTKRHPQNEYQRDQRESLAIRGAVRH